MELTLTLSLLKQSQLQPNQLYLLKLLYHKDFESIKEIFGIKEAILIRNSLFETPYILNATDNSLKFTETLISKKHVEKLLGIRSDNINFLEFYSCYPIRIGNRVLRSAGANTQIYQKHEKKYFTRVKTLEAHQIAIKAIEAFVAKQKSASKLQFLPNMETVMNNNLWEMWECFIDDFGTEGQDWNTQVI